jgi:hypothetical protein
MIKYDFQIWLTPDAIGDKGYIQAPTLLHGGTIMMMMQRYFGF